MKIKTSKYFLKKLMIYTAIVVVGLLMMIVLLRNVQNHSAQQRQKRVSEALLSSIITTLKNNEKDVKELEQIFHDENREALSDLRALISSGLLSSVSQMSADERAAYFHDIMERAGLEYLFLMNAESRLLLSPVQALQGSSLVELGFLSEENFRLLTEGATENPMKSQPVLEENGAGSFYFYSTSLTFGDNEIYLVLGSDSSILSVQFSALTDISELISSRSGITGDILFAVDVTTGEFLFFDDGNVNLSGENARSYGLTEKALKNGYSGMEKINGTDYFCVSRDFGDYIIICAAVDAENLYLISNRSLVWCILGFLAAVGVSIAYAVILRKYYLTGEETPAMIPVFRWRERQINYNHSVGRKLLPVIFGASLMVFGVAYLAQTLICLSEAVRQSENTLIKSEQSIAEGTATRKIIDDYYETRFLEKAKLLAFCLEEDPTALNEGEKRYYTAYDELGNRYMIFDEEFNQQSSIVSSSLLQKLAQENDIDSIYVYNDQGRVIATSTENWYFILGTDEESQSFPFREVLDSRRNFFIQERTTDDFGEKRQYIGVAFRYYTTTDEVGATLYVPRQSYIAQQKETWEGNPIHSYSSLLQISLNTDLIDRLHSSTDIKTILSGVKIVGDGFLVSFSQEEGHPIIYSPKTSDIGKTAAEAGYNETVFSGNFNGFHRLNGKEFFLCVRYINGCYVATELPAATLFADRIKTSMITTVNTLFFILLISAIFTLTTEQEEAYYHELTEQNAVKKKNRESNRFFTLRMPSGKEREVLSASARWGKVHMPWKSRTPEQKLSAIVRGVLVLLVIYVVLLMMNASSVFGDNSIVVYIMSGNWDKGFNIFAISACIAVMVIIFVGVWLIGFGIEVLTSIFGTKSETIGQLLKSVLKYGSVLMGLFYCLFLLGFDSASLLASAGIMSLVIGLGAQKLIGDIIAGIFIVFEGEFRVGDIITISDFRGQVLDIGLRTTKIIDGIGNIKIYNNSDISGVLNMTKETSLIDVDFGIDYSESLERVESVLKKEFPKIRKELPEITDGPFYRGVVEMADSSVVLRVSCKSLEKNVPQLRRDLTRQLYLVCQRNDISIPFPHVTLDFSEAGEQKDKPTSAEVRSARAFNRQQKNATEDIRE